MLRTTEPRCFFVFSFLLFFHFTNWLLRSLLITEYIKDIYFFLDEYQIYFIKRVENISNSTSAGISTHEIKIFLVFTEKKPANFLFILSVQEVNRKLRWPKWLTFHFHTTSQFRILNSEFRNLHCEFRNSEL